MYRPCNKRTNRTSARHKRQLSRSIVAAANVGAWWPARRRGLSLAELLVTMSIMSMMAVSMAILSQAVQQNAKYSNGTGAAIQHARVALGRIEHHLTTATASEDFPGFAVFSDTDATWDFPETLVLWNPDGAPANPMGPPLYSELIIYCPDPSTPNELLEITVPTDTRSTPDLSDTTTWQTELNAIKASLTANKVTLLDMLHTAAVDNFSSKRGAVRFVQRVLPSEDDWNDYQASAITWDDLPWVQDIHGANTGVRQSWCRIELQLEAREPGTALGSGSVTPFFGSAALYYELDK